MKKTLLSLITITFFLCEASFTGGGMAFAANKVGDTFTYNISGGGVLTCTITKVYTSSSNYGEAKIKVKTSPTSSISLTLPTTLNLTWSGDASKSHYDITAVEDDGFLDQTLITSINTSSKIKTIGARAFKGCSNITSVTIGAPVTSIGANAFEGCSNLTSVTWNAVNCSDFESYSTSPFYSRRTSITSFTIGTTVQHIPAYLCYGMTSLTGTKSFSSSLQSIGAYAFSGCTGLTSISFSSASNLTSIGERAFYGCTGLTSISSIGSATKLTTIGTYAFYNCNKVTSSITLPASLTTMGTDAFNSCTSMTGLTFAEGSHLTTLPNYAFYNCTKLAGTITIPSSVTSIGNYAFKNCSTVVAMNLQKATNLTSIGTYAFQNMSSVDGLLYIPSKVTSLGTYAFAGMTSIDGIVAMPTTPPTAGSAYTFNSVDKSIPVYVKDATAEGKYTAESCTGWKDFTNYKYETDAQQCGENLYWLFRFSTNRVVFTGSGDMWDYDNSSNKAPWRVYNDVLKYVDYATEQTGIGDYAFYQCSNYIPSSLTIRASIERIGQYAFYQCAGITSLSFGANSHLTSIGQRAFYGCSGLKSITFPEGLEVIPTYCFYNCNALTNVKFPSTLTTVGNSTFQYCSALKSIVLPASVTTLEGYAFANCSSIEFIKSDNPTPPAAQTSSFNSINKTTTSVCVPDGSNDDYCDAAGWSAFCSNIGQELQGTTGDVNWKLNFATHVLTIFGSGAMANTYSSSGISVAPWLAYAEDIHEVVVDENVTNIGQYAFYSATNLTKVTLPSTISYIGDYAFSGDNRIDTIICAASLVPEVKSHYVYSSGSTYVSSAFSNVPSNAVVSVPLSALATYKTTGVVGNSASKTGWNYFTNYHVVGTCGASEDNAVWDYADATGTITISGKGEMADYANATAAPWNTLKSWITAVIIEDGITKCGKYTFSNCTALTSISLAASCNSFGTYTFSECTALTEVTFPEGLTTTGSWMFHGCTNLVNVTLPSTLTKVDVRSFSQTGITSIEIPEGVTNINNYAFFQCASLASVGIPSTLTRVSSSAFEDCSSLASIDLPEGLTYIGSEAFAGCSSLESITIPRSVTTVYTSSNSYTFQDCSALRTVNWNAEACADFNKYNSGSGFTYYTPFGNAKPNITSFNFGENVRIIPSCLCQGMTGLTSVTLPASLEQIHQDAFNGCTGLESITIPANVTTMQGTVFDGCTSLTTVTTNAATPPTIQSTTFPSSVESAATLYVPATVASRTAYSNDTYWREFDHILPYVLTFDLQEHGETIDPICVNAGRVEEALKPADPTEDYYTFDGWFSNEACTTPFTFGESGTVVNSDLTLFAKWTLKGLALNENADNISAISAYDGLTTNVTMTRSLTNAQYNTFCLPFSLSASQMTTAFGEGYDLEELTDVTYDGEVLGLVFTQREALEAGKPYLLQPANNVSNPSFTGVEIDASTPSDGLDNTFIEFHGVYSPTELTGGNKNLLFLGAGNELFWPSSTGDLKGFRAYFEVKGSAQKAVRARIVKKEGSATGIDQITNDQLPITNKFLRNGQLLILRDGKTYNAQGMLVE